MNSEAHKAYKKRMRKWLNDLKSEHGCERCGEKRAPCLEFHHRNPNPEDKRISWLINNWGKEKILEEIKKCIVLCANCHCMEHWDEEAQNFTKDLSP